MGSCVSKDVKATAPIPIPRPPPCHVQVSSSSSSSSFSSSISSSSSSTSISAISGSSISSVSSPIFSDSSVKNLADNKKRVGVGGAGKKNSNTLLSPLPLPMLKNAAPLLLAHSESFSQHLKDIQHCLNVEEEEGLKRFSASKISTDTDDRQSSYRRQSISTDFPTQYLSSSMQRNSSCYHRGDGNQESPRSTRRTATITATIATTTSRGPSPLRRASYEAPRQRRSPSNDDDGGENPCQFRSKSTNSAADLCRKFSPRRQNGASADPYYDSSRPARRSTGRDEAYAATAEPARISVKQQTSRNRKLQFRESQFRESQSLNPSPRCISPAALRLLNSSNALQSESLPVSRSSSRKKERSPRRRSRGAGGAVSLNSPLENQSDLLYPENMQRVVALNGSHIKVYKHTSVDGEDEKGSNNVLREIPTNRVYARDSAHRRSYYFKQKSLDNQEILELIAAKAQRDSEFSAKGGSLDCSGSTKPSENKYFPCNQQRPDETNHKPHSEVFQRSPSTTNRRHSCEQFLFLDNNTQHPLRAVHSNNNSNNMDGKLTIMPASLSEACSILEAVAAEPPHLAENPLYSDSEDTEGHFEKHLSRRDGNNVLNMRYLQLKEAAMEAFAMPCSSHLSVSAQPSLDRQKQSTLDLAEQNRNHDLLDSSLKTDANPSEGGLTKANQSHTINIDQSSETSASAPLDKHVIDNDSVRDSIDDELLLNTQKQDTSGCLLLQSNNDADSNSCEKQQKKGEVSECYLTSDKMEKCNNKSSQPPRHSDAAASDASFEFPTKSSASTPHSTPSTPMLSTASTPRNLDSLTSAALSADKIAQIWCAFELPHQDV